MENLFEIDDPAAFLRAVWQRQKRRKPFFSLRYWAGRMGLANHASLHLVLSGKRPIPLAYVPKLRQTLGLSAEEEEFLQILVERSLGTSPKYDGLLQEKLLRLKQKNDYAFHVMESEVVLKQPLHYFLLEMTELKNFQPDLVWIQRQLKKPYTLQEISSCWERLLKLGLLEKVGKLTKKAHKHVNTTPDKAQNCVQEHHVTVCNLAAEQVKKQSVGKRQYNSLCFNINHSQLEKLKTEIQNFVEEFVSKNEAPSKEGTSTYQLNLQFFQVAGED